MVGPQTVVAVLGDAEEFVMELQVDEYDIAKVKLETRPRNCDHDG